MLLSGKYVLEESSMSAEKQMLILQILSRNRNKEMYGLEIIDASDGKLSQGTVYVHLARLEENGDITSRKEESPPAGCTPRRLYRLTDQGWRRSNQESHNDFYTDFLPAYN